MATLSELSDLLTGTTVGAGPLRNRVAIAAGKTATAIVVEPTPSAVRLAWAQNMLQHAPASLIDELFRYVILVNAAASVSTILNATDSLVESNVNTAVNALYA